MRHLARPENASSASMRIRSPYSYLYPYSYSLSRKGNLQNKRTGTTKGRIFVTHPRTISPCILPVVGVSPLRMSV